MGQGKRGIIRIIGDHPLDGAPVEAYVGRYGPYLKHGEINAPIPKNRPVEELTIEEAVALIEERRANPPEKKPKRGTKKKAEG